VAFNTIQFFEFLAVVLVLFYTSPLRFRRYILLFASYYFYGSWNAKFIVLLLTLTVIDYTAGLWIPSFAPGPKRKAVLILSLTANLGFLGFFKYYNFLASNLALLAGQPSGAFYLNIVLPLGISFHTFQSISYVVDVYRGEQEPIRDPVDYALYICFFPQLVAGPIVRARNFFGDLFHWNPPTAVDLSRGIFMIGLGLVKKMAFADQFAKVANSYFGHLITQPGWLPAWSGVFAFGMQIYFDFAGYTDIAIGVAKLFGFHFPPNFRRPYLAASITDFWRRWHISLSSWLRDYLYIPLGGNRGSRLATYRNLMLTMLLGGLWHGASWNFMIWGGYHGALLCVGKSLRDRQKIDDISPASDPGSSWSYPFRAVLTFLLVLVGWVFFRAADLTESMAVLGQMFHARKGLPLLEPWHMGLAIGSLVVALFEEKLDWFERLMDAPFLVRAAALGCMLFCLEIFGVTDAAIPFVYFQF
jgi:alginate O-acetyltransferase complex protein AlgI